MKKYFLCLLTCFAFSCNARSMEVTLFAPQAAAPTPSAERILVTSTLIDGSLETTSDPIELSLEGTTLPFSFQLNFSEEAIGKEVRISVEGFFGESEVYRASARGIVGQNLQAFIEFCGDEIISGEEECDEGFENSDSFENACRRSCVFAFCGDRVTDEGEDCDDGNGIEGDNCDTNCTISACGNGIISEDEICFSVNESLLGLLNPSDLLEADINQDGFLDLLSSHPDSNTLRIFLNDGAGNFRFGGDRSATGVTKLTKGDLDNDGDVDIVAAVEGNTLDAFQVFFNDNGTLLPLAPVDAAFSLSDFLLEDINQDGNLDLVLADKNANALKFRLGAGDGTFGSTILLPLSLIGTEPVSVASGDLTGDGFPDFAVANAGNNSLAIIQTLPSGSFIIHDPPLLLQGEPSAVVLGEFDSNGGIDIAVAQASTNQVRVFVNDEFGGFIPLADFPVGSSPSSLVSIDVDNDGDFDLATTNEGEDTISLLLNNGFAQFSEHRDEFGDTIRFDTRILPIAIVQGDFNQDSSSDLAVVGRNLGLVLSEP